MKWDLISTRARRFAGSSPSTSKVAAWLGPAANSSSLLIVQQYATAPFTHFRLKWGVEKSKKNNVTITASAPLSSPGRWGRGCVRTTMEGAIRQARSMLTLVFYIFFQGFTRVVAQPAGRVRVFPNSPGSSRAGPTRWSG